jgi:hypothetical protein
MTDRVGGQLDLILKRIDALYRCNHRGRLVSINQWNGGTAPRFYLMRTAKKVLCRFRANLPDDLVGRLEDLCTQETKNEPPGYQFSTTNFLASFLPTLPWNVSGRDPPICSRETCLRARLP